MARPWQMQLQLCHVVVSVPQPGLRKLELKVLSYLGVS
jgi:hypothetical protein